MVDRRPGGPGSIAAVVVNYNGGAAVLECVRSLAAQTRRPDCIVVVDNASRDGSAVRVRTEFPEVQVLERRVNGGWGVGCNQGIELTDSEFVALVNNDAYLDPQCLEQMVAAIEQDPQYGACASKILLWDDPQRIEVAGLVIYPDGSSVGRGRLRPASQYDRLEEVFCANDCCCLYRRAMIEDIGLYDPDFFIYCDETDIGYRHQLAGWKCVYTPHAIAYHAHSRAAGDYSDFKAYHVERNRILLCLKYYPLSFLVASVPRSVQRFVLQVWLSMRGRGALAHYCRQRSLWQGAAVLLRAHWDAVGLAPVMWRRRRSLRALRRLSDREFGELFRRFGVSAREIAAYE